MNKDLHLRLCPGVRLITDGDDLLVASPDGRALRQRQPGPALRCVLEALAGQGGNRDFFLELAQAADPGTDASAIHYVLYRLEAQGFLSYSLIHNGAPLATLEPVAAAFRPAPVAADALRFRLSRFAWLRREGELMLLECSLGHARLLLQHGPLVAAIGVLAAPCAVADLAAQVPTLDAHRAAALIELLCAMRAVEPCDGAGRIAEDTDPALRQWEFHDLLFHTRCRLGRHNHPYGATFPFVGELPHAPAIKPASGKARLTLPAVADSPKVDFFSVVAARRSVRDASEQPLSIEQLSAFLWHVARVQHHNPAKPDEPRQYEATLRPCSGGGAIHELELYLTVTRCAALPAAMYRYDPAAHELEFVAALGPAQEALVKDAMGSSGLKAPPDVLITLAARFARLAWKYQGVTYALCLKDVGVMYQQMYLVATALGLAPCALGGGNADRFAEAAGTDYDAETSVGEFILSGKAP